MTHKNRHEQRAAGARKDPRKKAWKTKRHTPKTFKDDYEREMYNEVEAYMDQMDVLHEVMRRRKL